MSEREKDTAFLRHCIRYDGSAERHKLEERITHLQQNERCVGRAVLLMALLIALAIAGVCYTAIFMADLPQNMTQFMTQFVGKACCVLGLGSLISLLVFMGLATHYRKELDKGREECRHLARKLLETRQGKRSIIPMPLPVKAAPALEMVALPRGLTSH